MERNMSSSREKNVVHRPYADPEPLAENRFILSDIAERRPAESGRHLRIDDDLGYSGLRG